MKANATNASKILPGIFENFKDINLGIIILSTYILFDFGAFQGVFEIVNTLRLPYILSVITIIYALYLVVSKRVNFASSTTRWIVFFVFYLLAYSQISTIQPTEKNFLLTNFLQYLANYIILVSCVKKPSQFIFIIDVWLFAILHSNYHVINQGGRIWDSIWLRGENNVGLLCAYAVPFAYFLYIAYRDSVKKYFYLLSMATSVTGVIMANSRGGFVALAVVTFCCWLFVKKKIRVMVLILMAAILVVQFAPDKFFVELESLEQGTEEGTANERVYSWGLAVKMFADNPVFGVGPSNYPEYFLEYDDDDEGRFTRNATGRRMYTKRVAHSTQFQWLAEFGTVGLLILFYFQLSLYRNWKVIYKYKPSDQVLSLSDVNTLKMVSHANIITQIGFWVAALFISVVHYPFYWVLPAFSEVWKNIYMSYVEENKETGGIKQGVRPDSKATTKRAKIC